MDRRQALEYKHPELVCGIDYIAQNRSRDGSAEDFKWLHPTMPEPTDDEFVLWESQIPLQELRDRRDGLLAETDWWASSDLTMSAERKAYRLSLRDLPSTAKPKLDKSGRLAGVTWPQKPE